MLLHEEEHARAVEREVAVMRQFSHPNLLPLYAAELDPPEQLAVRGREFLSKDVGGGRSGFRGMRFRVQGVEFRV